MKGQFIVVEGLDGSGKTTVVERLTHYLQEAGVRVIRTREPGGTPLAEMLRDGMKYGFTGMQEETLSPMVQTLLMNAARADHLEKVILPRLREGYVVISDRFVDSALAYQGGAGGVSLAVLKGIHHFAHDAFYPDLTLLLDGDPSQFATRMLQRGQKDALDALQTTKADSMREVYLNAYRANPGAYKLIHADLPEENVWRQVKGQADVLIELLKAPEGA